MSERGQKAKPFSELGHMLLSHFQRSNDVRIGVAAILCAAERRDITWRRLDDRKRLQLDSGSQVRKLNGSVTDRTTSAAIALAGDKIKARDRLYASNLPVPRQVEVYSEKEAVVAARELKGPVVTKPVRGNDGKGVSVNLCSPDEIREGYRKALKCSDRVLIEEHIDGDDFRLLVIGGVVVAAVRRIPAHVQGDGIRTIRELIDIVNSDPQRGVGHTNVLTTITIDDDMQALLSSSDYTLGTVPAKGTNVFLRRIANVSLGGTAADVTDKVHTDVEQMAVEATTAVGLDIAGVDYIAKDVGQSWRESGGRMCEINAGPGLRIHLAPSEGAGRDVGEAIVSWLFASTMQSYRRNERLCH